MFTPSYHNILMEKPAAESREWLLIKTLDQRVCEPIFKQIVHMLNPVESKLAKKNTKWPHFNSA